MKLLFTSLGIFLLYLSCIPCSDSNECEVKGQVTLSASADHQQHSHEKEACTPFCTCACCAISTFSSPVFKSVPARITFDTEKFFPFNVAVKIGVHHSIFQPPKLS